MKWQQQWEAEFDGIVFIVYESDIKYTDGKIHHMFEWYCHNEDHSVHSSSETPLASLKDAELDAEIWLERHLERVQDEHGT